MMMSHRSSASGSGSSTIVLILLLLCTVVVDAFVIIGTTKGRRYHHHYHHTTTTSRGSIRTQLHLSNSQSISSNNNNNLEPDTCSIDDYYNENITAACLLGAGYKQVPIENLKPIDQVYVAELEKLSDRGFPSSQETNLIRFDRSANRKRSAHKFHRQHQQHDNNDNDQQSSSSSSSKSSGTSTHYDSSRVDMEYNELMDDNDLVLVDIVRNNKRSGISRAFVQAGPRKQLHFNPSNVNAAIVTCGGLCPGLNNVIREITHSLYYLYGINKVYGIQGGFHGFYKFDDYPPILLTNEIVEDIHHMGGTVLRSGRGGFDIEKILQFFIKYDIQQLYVIGGDGTHRGAYAIHEACLKNNLNIAITGIPKTIDNDVDFIDRSFGFSSAVEAAQASIRTAKTEAMCNVPNGIGIIKLMGRSAGFLSAFAALGSGDVDLVLIPEVPIVLDGDDGILPYIRKRVKEHKYAVIVVAEGAGEEILGISDEVDAGGNRILPKIGDYITKKIQEYFDSYDEVATIKYIDPSYTVRSVPANAADSLYCTQLSQSAVHGAMAGYTGFTCGLVNNKIVYLPIPTVVASSPRTMDANGMTWGRIVAMTGQPNTAVPKVSNDENEMMDELTLPEPSFH